MGTRNLTMVVADGEYKISQYCQWDGYPSGQGVTVLDFLRNKMKRDVFLKKVRALKEITEKEHKALWTECGADPNYDFVSMDVADEFKKQHPHLYRDMGADILEYVQNSKAGLKIKKDIKFAANSLFCEYVYVIDFDKNTFEVYQGFRKKPLAKTERFKFLEEGWTKPVRLLGRLKRVSPWKAAVDGSKKEYYPVSLKAKFSLKRLPAQKEFLRKCK